MTQQCAALTSLAFLAFAKAQHDRALPEIRGLLAGLTVAFALLTLSSTN
ncbi:hypothetical protein ACFRR6_24560 [Streptomyces sp. NPDC056891]